MPRPRKPAAIKKAKGTIRKCYEGNVSGTPVTMSDEFSAPVRFEGCPAKMKYWGHYTAQLKEMEVLSTSDREMLTLLVETTVMNEELNAAWEAMPFLDDDGQLSKSKKELHTMMMQAKSKMLSQLTACGFTPGSRSGLMRRERARTTDPLDEFK